MVFMSSPWLVRRGEGPKLSRGRQATGATIAENDNGPRTTGARPATAGATTYFVAVRRRRADTRPSARSARAKDCEPPLVAQPPASAYSGAVDGRPASASVASSPAIATSGVGVAVSKVCGHASAWTKLRLLF